MPTPKPYGERVIVRPEESKNLSEDGIEFAQAKAAETVRGVVVAIPENSVQDVGNLLSKTILFSKYAGEEISDEKGLIKIISLRDIMAVYE